MSAPPDAAHPPSAPGAAETRGHAVVDVAIVGAGAAGLATAIFTARRLPRSSIVALDGARKPGAKILISGGGRCNVTNVTVTEADFWGGSRHVLRRVLNAFPAPDAERFFRELGVALHVEDDGKLFPDSHRARTVLAALLDEAARRGVRLLTGQRVTAVRRCAAPADNASSHARSEPDHGAANRADGATRGAAFRVCAADGELPARAVVLATGGLSLPKTGSDGGGYEIARSLGHSIVPTTPALTPLILDGDFHAPLAGVSQDAELTVRSGRSALRLRGPLLWTHFGVSGPVVLNASRHWHRARIEQRPVQLFINFLPGLDFAAAERALLDLAALRPTARVHNALADRLPARLAEALVRQAGIHGELTMSRLDRAARRRLVHVLTQFPLPVRDSRGYAAAEVTAGGVPLTEIDPADMQSRRCPGLFLVGEILDVDGRIGGFNFQWAWSSAFVAAAGIARYLRAAGLAPPTEPSHAGIRADDGLGLQRTAAP